MPRPARKPTGFPSVTPKSGGFTLIEVLLALALSVGIVSLAVGSWFLAVRHSTASGEYLEQSSRKALALQHFSRDLANAWARTSERLPQVLVSQAIPEAPGLPFSCNLERLKDKEWSRLQFLSSGPPVGGAGELGPGLHQVTWFVAALKDGTYGLVRSGKGEQEKQDQDFPGTVILKGLVRFEAEILVAGRWQSRWTGSERQSLPEAVRLHLRLAGDTEDAEATVIPTLSRMW